MPQRQNPTSLRVISPGERADDLTPPSWLSVGALEEWRLIFPKLKKAGVLAQTDEMALAVYCELAAEFKECPTEFPAAKLTQLRLIMADFGLTPHSRATMSTQGGGSGNKFSNNGRR